MAGGMTLPRSAEPCRVAHERRNAGSCRLVPRLSGATDKEYTLLPSNTVTARAARAHTQHGAARRENQRRRNKKKKIFNKSLGSEKEEEEDEEEEEVDEEEDEEEEDDKGLKSRAPELRAPE
ncbi:hypothetical protein V1478_008803 [Vespula squamosa]|uniref:Uncharacterized protein n=1 Tax=Vespula squamosa TaxID=30214 RepID=A0ABD2AUY7_VESSQ